MMFDTAKEESQLEHQQQYLFQQIMMNQHNGTDDFYTGVATAGSLIHPDSDYPSPFFPWPSPTPPVNQYNMNTQQQQQQQQQQQTHFNPVRENYQHLNNTQQFTVPYGNFFNRVLSPPAAAETATNGLNSLIGYDQSENSIMLSESSSVLLEQMVSAQQSSGGMNSYAGHNRHHHNMIMGKLSAQEIMDAKALAASKSHSEAERRRRERINNHLARLRSLLPSTTKTDKASLLAEVIQHVKDLKRQTSLIAETSPIPTEINELTVDTSDEYFIEDGKVVIKALLCCEDRQDLLPDLIKTLKTLRLRTLKAEITTLGGRVKNVLFVTGENEEEDDEEEQQRQYCISSIQEALKAVMEKTAVDQNSYDDHQSSSSGNAKRQRVNRVNNNNNNNNII